ncbi:LutC/YkgG family protein [Bacillus pinisoli]|uniref:LutC/YkgG family protein n=1 Tax=Bacillus pinisoli TaxID=2901866 RepID=UPI001FF410E1|nr:lactate utilization protein C [Bacillus pinisoli]
METGQIYNKDYFLNQVASKLGRNRRTKEVVKPNWNCSPQLEVLKNATLDDLVHVLKKQCEVIHTDVYEVSMEELVERLRLTLKKYDANSIITWDDQRFSQYQLDHFLYNDLPVEGLHVHKWDRTRGNENIKLAEQADVGITFSDITLAESGTVVLFSSADKGRSVSLLPKTYIAIIPKSTIVQRMTQATDYISQKVKSKERISSCINFISGPSNSADIELNLVVGVHGPIKATYIIVEDGPKDV